MKHFTYEGKYGTYEDSIFQVGHYDNGNIAIELWSNSEGPISRITVNPDIPLPNDRIAIKNYSENEGMVDWLISMDIIEHDPITIIHSGWVEIPVHKLTKIGKEILDIE